MPNDGEKLSSEASAELQEASASKEDPDEVDSSDEEVSCIKHLQTNNTHRHFSILLA